MSLLTTSLFGTTPTLVAPSLARINDEFVSYLREELIKDGFEIYELFGLSNNELMSHLHVLVNLYRSDIEDTVEAEQILNRVRGKVYTLICQFPKLRPYVSTYPFPYTSVDITIRCRDPRTRRSPIYPKINAITTAAHPYFEIGLMQNGKLVWKLVEKKQ